MAAATGGGTEVDSPGAPSPSSGVASVTALALALTWAVGFARDTDADRAGGFEGGLFGRREGGFVLGLAGGADDDGAVFLREPGGRLDGRDGLAGAGALPPPVSRSRNAISDTPYFFSNSPAGPSIPWDAIRAANAFSCPGDRDPTTAR